MTELEKVREKIREMVEYHTGFKLADASIDQILAIKGICIEADDQSLPEPQVAMAQKQIGYARGVWEMSRAMLQAGFKKVIKVGGK